MAVKDTELVGGLVPRPGWLALPHDADLTEWAERNAKRLYEEKGLPSDGLDVRRLASMLAVAADSALEQAAARYYIYCPDPIAGPELVLTLSLADLPPERGWDYVDEHLLLPADESARPPQMEFVETPAGGSRKITQWNLQPGGQVQVWYTRTWISPELGILVIGSAVLADLLVAGERAEEIDAMLDSLVVERLVDEDGD